LNKLDLIKKFLPGILPLLIFIAADEIWGTKIGLIVAVTFGIGQFLFIFFKNKTIDKMVLLDTGLIVLMGGISFILDNDIFFKLKPAIIGLILCIILGISAFTKFNFMVAMSQRYMKGVTLSDDQIRQFTRSLRILFFIFSAHTLLVFYSAIFMSKEAWAFISTALFYILFGVYFLYEFAWQKYKVSKTEWLPVVDEKGNLKGKASREMCHKDKTLLHPVVHLHVVNNKKQILLQKRPMNKLVQPGKWDTAVGGHIAYSETVEIALKREAKEEIGLDNFNAKLIAQYKWESDIESELIFMFVCTSDKEFQISNEEVDECKFWTLKEIKENIGKEIFTPNFEHEFREFF